MMKTQNKSRKHPTCSRCRFHGKKDIRVLQHQCPFRNCTCSSCFLIKRRSIIYRAQKNLDKNEDNSSDEPSSGESMENSLQSTSFSEANVSCKKNTSASSSTNGTTNGSNFVHSSGGSGSWDQTDQFSHQASVQPKSNDYYKIEDFQTLCTTFPDYKPSQLQHIFEQCGSDFQKTIDKILVTKWYNESESKSSQANPYQNNNDWSNGEFALPNGSASNYHQTVNYSHDGMQPNNGYYNGEYYNWSSPNYISNEEPFNSEANTGYYSDQSYQSNASLYQQGISGVQSPYNNWTYYNSSSYWYSQGSSNGTQPFETANSTNFTEDGSGWPNGQDEVIMPNLNGVDYACV